MQFSNATKNLVHVKCEFNVQLVGRALRIYEVLLKDLLKGFTRRVSRCRTRIHFEITFGPSYENISTKLLIKPDLVWSYLFAHMRACLHFKPRCTEGFSSSRRSLHERAHTV